MSKEFTADMLQACIAMAHDDWLKQQAQHMAALDAMLDQSFKLLDEWVKRNEVLKPISVAAAMWIGRRYLDHMWNYGRIISAEAHDLLRKYIHVLGHDDCLDTMLSPVEYGDGMPTDTERALDMIEVFLVRLHQAGKVAP